MPILTKEQVLEAIYELPSSEYEDIRALLCDSPSDEQIAEGERRLEAHRADPETSVPAHEVLAKLRAKL